MTTKTADKNRRAPRGYTRGAPQEFIIRDSDGNNLPPIYIQPYISRTSGAVLGFDLTDLHEGRLERPDMATWRAAVTDALRARIKDSKPTRHIAVVAYASSGRYRLAFWPIRRQVALDGTVHWSDVITAQQAGGCLLDPDDIDWDFGGASWCTTPPWIWETDRHNAVVLDWSPETWDGLIAIRRSLDSAMERIGELVTSPALLGEHFMHQLAPAAEE